MTCVLFVGDGEEMDEQRDGVARPKRMFAVRKNFDVTEEPRQQRAQARAGEEILVVALEEMPGDDAPIVQVRKQLHIGNGKESAPADDSRDLTDERFRIGRVLNDLDADGAIEFGVRARQAIAFYFAKRQLAALKDSAAMRVCFQAEPIVTFAAQGRPVRTGATPDIDNRPALRQIG